VAINGFYNTEPAFDYFVVAHYAGDWKRPVIFLMDAPDERIANELASKKRLWMVGHNARADTARILPGWSIGAIRGVGKKNAVWLVTPPVRNVGKQ
jgi:hypothetical protein